MTVQQRFIQLDSSLKLAGIEQSCSEVHGVVFGSIANHMYTSNAPDLLALVATSDNIDANLSALSELLNELYRETSELLLDTDDEISLFLLDEDASLDERAASLADWCRGYLLGLLQGEQLSLDRLPEDGPEIARDILAISEAAYSESDNQQEEEWALAELEEYVKVGVRLLFEFILRYQSSQQQQAMQPPSTIQ